MKKHTLAATILEGLLEVGGDLLYLLPKPLENKYDWAYRLRIANFNSYTQAVRRLEKRGYLEVINKEGQKFLKITKNGELYVLMNKVGIDKAMPWDGKWRLVLFDIPERSKDKRWVLRCLLKQNNFFKLQASVYITPYPLNREAIVYLKSTELISFIRILRVDELDDSTQLKKYFNLP